MKINVTRVFHHTVEIDITDEEFTLLLARQRLDSGAFPVQPPSVNVRISAAMDAVRVRAVGALNADANAAYPWQINLEYNHNLLLTLHE